MHGSVHAVNEYEIHSTEHWFISRHQDSNCKT